MALVLVIDGLTAEGDEGWANWLPNLQRLAMLGEQVQLTGLGKRVLPESLQPWLSRLGLPERASSAWFSAYEARRSEPHASCWCHLGFTHLFRKEDTLRYVSPARTGQSMDELRALGQSLNTLLEEAGWQLRHQDGEGLILCSENPWQVDALPLRILEGASALEVLPQGRDGKKLQSLINSMQLVLSRDPINEQRLASGRLPLNTPWFWGFGPAPQGEPREPWQGGELRSSDAAVRGLGRFLGWQVGLMPEEEREWHWDESAKALAQRAAQEDVLIHLQGPAVFARHGMHGDRAKLLKLWDQQLWSPMERDLKQAGADLVIIEGYPLEKQGIGAPLKAPQALLVRAKKLGKPSRFWHRLRGEREQQVEWQGWSTTWKR
uniref:Phosphoglycerate mutase n=1 Tax=Magnetococcus massalia (strain MO-1) TaxID=451514 RepID=A0A1S7LHE3_MAGMO|nr:Conserved protein of unknown function [Candidatus Magnetococcus massalia]